MDDRRIFEEMVAKYPQWSFAFWCPREQTYLHSIGYYDGGWLEGYAIEPIFYWGA